jgi:plastocyanin domain-containing protein
MPLASLISSVARFGRSSALVALLALASACSASAEPPPPLANKVSMVVTDKGFEPQNLRVKKGEPVTLTITRTSDATCATEIVIDEYKVKTPLPLNTPVTVTFTPSKTGQLKYGCAMQKMIGGVITII